MNVTRHPAATDARREQGRRWVAALLRGRIISVIVFLLALIAIFSLTGDHFATPASFRSIGENASLFAIIACGEAMVILTGNYDLSVGSTMGLASYVAYDQGLLHPEMSILVIPVTAVGVGIACGLVNGLLVAYGRIPSVVATLGTLSVFRGILYIYGARREFTNAMMPDWSHDLVATQVFGLVASLVVIAVVVVVVAALGLRYLPIGRQIYAVGSNPAACDLYGLDRRRVVLRSYILCGALTGFAGLLFAPQVSYILQYAGQDYELTVIAAVVIGGISISGGSGNILGAGLGALLLATVNNGLVHLSLPEFARQLIQGGAIILAVLSDGLISDRARSVLRATRRRGVDS
jgi:rhamnose transport system permease protein